MTNALPRLLAAALTAGLLLQPAPAAAQLSRSGATEFLHPAKSLATWANEVKGMDVALDPVGGRYIAVTAFGSVYGVLVDASTGKPAGSPFLIPSSTGGFAHYPRVEYSPHLVGGAGGFLVTWSEDGLTVQATVISTTGTLVGPQLQLDFEGARNQAAPAIAYSTTSRRFLVAWQTTLNSIRTQLIDVAAGSGTISKYGGIILVTNPQTSRDPGVAWDSVTNQFGISYTGWDNQGALAGFVRLAPNGGNPVGRQVFGYTSAGTYMSDIEFNTITKRFVMAWTNNQGTNWAEIASDSTIVSSGLVSVGLGGTDNLGIAFNPQSNTLLAVGQPTQAGGFGITEIVGVEMNGTGTPLSVAQLLTSVTPIKDSFYPRVAANPNGRQWDIAYNYSQSTMTSQLVTTASTGTTTGGGGGGGGTPPPPPPPPPPTCDVTLSSYSETFGAFGGAGGFTLSTGSTCAWTAGTNVPWLILGSSSKSGTGNQLMSYSVLANDTSGTRQGIIYVGNRSVTVTQAGKTWKTTDFNLDGRNDILWQNQATGHLSVWRMNGINQSDDIAVSPGVVADTNWKIVGTLDANRDGSVDILWQHDGGWVSIWLMNGETLSQAVELSANATADPRWRIVATGDMDRDGYQDIIWQHQNGAVSVWFMNGTQLRGGQVIASLSDANWRVRGADDFDRDGNVDLLWHHAATGHVAVWQMSRTTLVDGILLGFSVPDTNWQIEATADLNSDAKPDLIWRNTSTGHLAAWLMDGLSFTVDNGVFLNPSQVVDTNWKIVGPR